VIWAVAAAVVAVAASGAYLRWAARPVLGAYGLGVHVGRRLARRS
jgi:hypothetical protein